MVKCVFCGKEENSFRGIHLVRNDGFVSYFCSSKCRKNSTKLGRDPRKVMWTEAYRINLEKSKAKKEKAEKAEEKKEESASDKKPKTKKSVSK